MAHHENLLSVDIRRRLRDMLGILALIDPKLPVCDAEQSCAHACSGRPSPLVVSASVMCDGLGDAGPEGVEIVDYH